MWSKILKTMGEEAFITDFFEDPMPIALPVIVTAFVWFVCLFVSLWRALALFSLVFIALMFGAEAYLATKPTEPWYY